MNGWGGRREGAGRGRVKTLNPDELRTYARQGMSRARAALFLGVSWAVVDREARRLGLTFASPRFYGYVGDRGRYGHEKIVQHPNYLATRRKKGWKLTRRQAIATLATP